MVLIKTMMQQLRKPRGGQVLVMFALLIVVLIGIVALSIDLGITYSQRRAMQNAADAAALGGAYQLAGAVGSSSSGGIVFSVADQDVRATVQSYINKNKGWQPAAASYQLPASNPCGASAGSYCLQYLDVNGNVIANSPTSNGAVPSNTSMVRVATGVNFSTLFAPLIGVNKMTATARATAQISPAQKPQYPEGPTWPMTRWDQGTGITAPAANQKCPQPAVFWAGSSSYNTGVTGQWKELIYFGRKSAYDNTTSSGITSNHDQLITQYGSGTYPNGQPVDPYAGNPPANLTGQDVQSQLEYWFKYGWNGKLHPGTYLAPPGPSQGGGNAEPGAWTPGGAYGDKVETIQGNMGNNMSAAMQYFVEHHVAGADTCGDLAGLQPVNYAIVPMYLWNPSSAETWVSNGNPPYFKQSNSNINRVTLKRWVYFKFYDSVQSFPNGSGGGCGGQASGNSVICGYFVSDPVDGPPTGGSSSPPSPDANVVHLVN